MSKELLAKLKTQKGSMHKVETGTGDLRGIQRHCPIIQRSSSESQGLGGFECSTRCQRPQEGLL